MEKYISLLLFVAPGFFARTIVDKFTCKDEIKSDIEKTLISLLYGLPIWLITIIILYLFMDISNVLVLKNSLNNTIFIIKYTFITIFSTIILSFIVLIYELKVSNKIIKKIRKFLKLQDIAEEENGWKQFFKKSKTGKILGIYKGKDEIAIGILKNNSANNSSRSEIILEKSELIESLRDTLNAVDNIYIDLEKDIVIKEYYIKDEE